MLWTPKQLKSEEMKWKETKLKTGANFKYITALISYCLDKSVLWVVLVFFFNRSSVHLLQFILRLRVSGTVGERMRKPLDLQLCRKQSSIYVTHTRLSGLIQTNPLCSLQTITGEWHQILQFENVCTTLRGWLRRFPSEGGNLGRHACTSLFKVASQVTGSTFQRQRKSNSKPERNFTRTHRKKITLGHFQFKASVKLYFDYKRVQIFPCNISSASKEKRMPSDWFTMASGYEVVTSSNETLKPRWRFRSTHKSRAER